MYIDAYPDFDGDGNEKLNYRDRQMSFRFSNPLYVEKSSEHEYDNNALEAIYAETTLDNYLQVDGTGNSYGFQDNYTSPYQSSGTSDPLRGHTEGMEMVQRITNPLYNSDAMHDRLRGIYSQSCEGGRVEKRDSYLEVNGILAEEGEYDLITPLNVSHDLYFEVDKRIYDLAARSHPVIHESAYFDVHERPEDPYSDLGTVFAGGVGAVSDSVVQKANEDLEEYYGWGPEFS